VGIVGAALVAALFHSRHVGDHKGRPYDQLHPAGAQYEFAL